MQTQKIEPKAIYRLKSLVGYDCLVRLRSSPETIISGVLDSFDLGCVPSILTIGTDRGLRIINFQDVSFIEEIR
jgi:hypothetical protein